MENIDNKNITIQRLIAIGEITKNIIHKYLIFYLKYFYIFYFLRINVLKIFKNIVSLNQILKINICFELNGDYFFNIIFLIYKLVKYEFRKFYNFQVSYFC
jgi:hypothetical protein